LKVVYFGGGEVSREVLKNLLNFVKPILVVTKPGAPKGRGKKLQATPVKELALEVGIEVLTPESLTDGDFLKKLKEIDPDFIMLADYGGKLPKEVLEIPKLFPLCFHPSLLPKYRGASPIERAFFNCEDILGLTVFVMTERIDEGKIVLQDKIPINPCEETKGDVIPKVAKIGAEMLYRSALMILGGFRGFKEQAGEVSYAPKIKPEEEFVKPEEGVKRTVGKINGLSPKPGARYIWKGKNLKILHARPIFRERECEIGEIFYDKRERKLILGCADGCVEILKIQVEGRRVITGEEFARGYLRQP
jgi:methionyl-tRNA formyltransferase